jgi:hypothetical protein
MNVYEVLKHTIFIAVPVTLVICLMCFGLGFPEIALGVLLGVAGGMAKSFVMSFSAIHETSRVISLIIRFLIIGIAFAGGILISNHAFFAAVAGVFFVHIVFIMDQVNASNIGELR